MKTLADLNADEWTEAKKILAELERRGYAPRERFNELAPDVRVRHHGHRWPSAYSEGTGVVVAIAERNPSSWAQTYRVPDIEMVVAYDKPLLPEMSRLTTLAQYHVQAVTAPNSLECDGGIVGGSFPTACGRDYVHASHPLGQPPATNAAPSPSCPSCGSVTNDGPILGRKAIDKGDGPEWCDDEWHDQENTDCGSYLSEPGEGR